MKDGSEDDDDDDDEEEDDAGENPNFESRAYGCILGAFIGDSCGSYLEFETNAISEE